jgi:hypothetical protein
MKRSNKRSIFLFSYFDPNNPQFILSFLAHQSDSLSSAPLSTSAKVWRVLKSVFFVLALLTLLGTCIARRRRPTGRFDQEKTSLPKWPS